MGRRGMIHFLVIAEHSRIFRRRMLKNGEIAFIRPGRGGGVVRGWRMIPWALVQTVLV